MDYCRPSKSISDKDEDRDLISQLPANVKDKILEHLSTRVAARTAVLSTCWKDVWLQHGRLVFDSHFFDSVRRCETVKKCKGDRRKVVVNIVNDILFFRAGPIKKFTLEIGDFHDPKHGYTDPKLQQCELDRLCVYLSRNGVVELNMFLGRGTRYKLPASIVSCPTIKRLRLKGFDFGFMVNSRCIFPSVTSLALVEVNFEQNIDRILSSIPNLVELAFLNCRGMDNFEISAPKLKGLSAIGHQVGEWRCFMHQLEKIETLCVSVYSWLRVAPAAVPTPKTFPTAINLQVIKLHSFSFESKRDVRFAMLLLRKSPNLCKLEIVAKDIGYFSDDDDDDDDDDNDDDGIDYNVDEKMLLESLDGCIINEDMKMLKTVKIESYCESKFEMFFVKTLLSKSPALEEVVIHLHYAHDSNAFKITRELLRSPRASQKALIFVDLKALIFVDFPGRRKLVSFPELLDGFI